MKKQRIFSDIKFWSPPGFEESLDTSWSKKIRETVGGFILFFLGCIAWFAFCWTIIIALQDDKWSFKLLAILGVSLFLIYITVKIMFRTKHSNMNQSVVDGFDKAPEGVVLGTIRNEKIVESLRERYGSSSNMPESIRNEVGQFHVSHTAFAGDMIDLYTTPEEAQKAYKRKILTAELNKKYLEDQKK